MNKQMKQHLEAVVESIIFDDAAAAKDAFHQYLSMKTQSILVGESKDEADDECDDECTDDKSEDKSEDKKSKKDKKDKKDEGDEE